MATPEGAPITLDCDRFAPTWALVPKRKETRHARRGGLIRASDHFVARKRKRSARDRLRWPAVRVVGINHVALEVGDVDEALAWYGRFFEFELRGRAGAAMAFIDMGDQFIAMAAGRTQPPDQARHFGLVVDDKQAVRTALRAAGVSVHASGSLDFLDPWGNHVQVVDYREIQFSKSPAVLRGMGVGALEKTPAAKQELRSKGLADDQPDT